MSEHRIQLRCDGCDKDVTFPIEDAGTVQECPECGGYLDVPTLAPSQRSDEHGRQTSETDRQLAVSARQQEETERQLQVAKRQTEDYQKELELRFALIARQEKLFEKMESLVDRWFQLADRFEKALSRFEQK